MTEEKVMASVTFKSRSGLSVLKDIQKLSVNNVIEFSPILDHITPVANMLTRAGFKVEAQTDIGLSFSGPIDLFRSEFDVTISPKKKLLNKPGMLPKELKYYEASKPKFLNSKLEPFVEYIQLAIPGIPCHSADLPVPNPDYYHLKLENLPDLLHVTSLHNDGKKGEGISVLLVDTGIFTKVTETPVPISITQVEVDHKIKHVYNVYDPKNKNHYTGDNCNDTRIIPLGYPLDNTNDKVTVEYSCLHPYFTRPQAPNYNFGNLVAADDKLDKYSDEYGHGTACAAIILAVAPGCTLSVVKYRGIDQNNYPLLAFQKAVLMNPDIIVCPWTTYEYDESLHQEIADAVGKGIVVIFPTGDKNLTDDPTTKYTPLTYPGLISVGGAYPINPTTYSIDNFKASKSANSFDSLIYTDPQRHCPDIVGLIGDEKLTFIELPTQPESNMDFTNDGTNNYNDGWCILGGTSMAAAQVAGMAALLLQEIKKYFTSLEKDKKYIVPMAVKNILENSALEITKDTNGNPDNATGWKDATGFGLVDGSDAFDLEKDKFVPYIRDSVEDNGIRKTDRERLYASPDIIVRNEPVDDPERELGQTVKHRYDLCDIVEDGQDNYVYLRVQNMGTNTGKCSAALYYINPAGTPGGVDAWTFNQWKKINTEGLEIPSLKPGEFRVVGPIVWKDDAVPVRGHYCLVSVLDYVEGSDSLLGDLQSINDIESFKNKVHDSNRVAWKNIDVVDIVPEGAYQWSFSLQIPEEHRGKRADLIFNLNEFYKATVKVKVVKRLADTGQPFNMTPIVDPSGKESKTYTMFEHLGSDDKDKRSFGLKDMRPGYKENTKVTLYYLPKDIPEGTYPTSVDLIIDGIKVNSYTKIMNVSSFAYIGNRRSREIHKRECPWVAEMSSYNKIPLVNLEEARKRGFDNCATCMGNSLR